MLEVLRCINFKTPANTLWRHPFVVFGRRSTPHILEARADDRGHVHNADFFFPLVSKCSFKSEFEELSSRSGNRS